MISMRSGSAITLLLGRGGNLGFSPLITTALRLLEEFRHAFFVSSLEQLLERFDPVHEKIDCPREIFSVGQCNVAPHFRRTGSDASGIAKTIGAEPALFRRLIGREHAVG